uniref:Uncharacterized protein n=1 Tax=Arundo donax TaxID=35708 RepID=A0A0A9F4A0_ARUDO
MILRQLRTSAALRRRANDGGILAALRAELAHELSSSAPSPPPSFHSQVTHGTHLVPPPPGWFPNPNPAPHAHLSPPFAGRTRLRHRVGRPPRAGCAAAPPGRFRGGPRVGAACAATVRRPSAATQGGTHEGVRQ